MLIPLGPRSGMMGIVVKEHLKGHRKRALRGGADVRGSGVDPVGGGTQTRASIAPERSAKLRSGGLFL